MRRFHIVPLLVLLTLATTRGALAQTAAPSKQAVVDTTVGTFVIDLLPESAPNQVAYFTRTAETGAYDGTTFHFMLKNGMVQGGDPLSKDPAKVDQYGTGGLNAVKADPRAAKMTAGSVAAFVVKDRPDSAGAQFFMVIVDQPALDGQYPVFGRIAEGMDIVRKISETPTNTANRALERVAIRRVTIRDTPPPIPEPFSTESIQELEGYRAILDTSAGPITLEFIAGKATAHVRQFLRLAQAGVFDGTAFHRVVPGFVIQTGALSSRQTPLTDQQQKLVHNLQPEFNDTKHVKGIVSMARGDDPASATTSFFICTAPSPVLDGQYTAFAHVTDGMSVVEAIESVPRTGETPNSRVELKAIRIEPPRR